MSTTRVDQDDLILEANIKLYYDLHLPQRCPAPLLIALHGYGANKRQIMREAKQMVPEGFAIASLQGFHQHMREAKEAGGPLRFGFGWLTNFRPEESVTLHHHALLSLINQLTDKKVADPDHLFLLGFSQSCALNYRFAFTHPERLRGVIGICGGLPGDWDTSELYKSTRASVFHLAGTGDEFYPPDRIQDYTRQLQQRADDVEFRSYEAAHEIVPAMRADVHNWLERRTYAT
jgi:phospholipase/carboxylesterase